MGKDFICSPVFPHPRSPAALPASCGASPFERRALTRPRPLVRWGRVGERLAVGEPGDVTRARHRVRRRSRAAKAARPPRDDHRSRSLLSPSVHSSRARNFPQSLRSARRRTSETNNLILAPCVSILTQSLQCALDGKYERRLVQQNLPDAAMSNRLLNIAG
jgi:hypothetical protein